MLSDKKLERFALAACACCCTIGITAGIGYGIAFHTFGDVVVDAVVAAAVTSILFVAALCIKKGWYKSTPKTPQSMRFWSSNNEAPDNDSTLPTVYI